MGVVAALVAAGPGPLRLAADLKMKGVEVCPVDLRNQKEKERAKERAKGNDDEKTHGAGLP